MKGDDISEDILPLDLVGVIRLNEWKEIVRAFNLSTREGHSYACFVEILICVFFFFPLIFICHFCLATSVAKSLLDM